MKDNKNTILYKIKKWVVEKIVFTLPDTYRKILKD